MENEKVYQMSFAKVYQCLINKAVRKGRTKEDVDTITMWLTGYGKDELQKAFESSITHGDFFRNAPELNPNRKLIKGSICGIKIEEISEPLMQEMRYLDKLIDELAKGKSMDKILRA